MVYELNQQGLRIIHKKKLLILILTRMTLASILEPFGVHLLKFRNSRYLPQFIDALFGISGFSG